MHICPECGGKFEGRFCPDCGAHWVEKKNCPQCGTEVDGAARFCGSCGYSFSGRQAAVQSGGVSEASIKKTAIFYKYAVVVLFGLLSALSFAFFAAPVSKDPFFGMSAGSVYDRLFGKEGDLSGFIGMVHIAPVFLSVLGVLIFIGGIVMALTDAKGFNRLDQACLTFFILYMITSIGLMATVEEGMKVGACPVLMLIFSILFTAAAITVLVLRKRFYNRHSNLDDQIFS